jgi:hypothetical protein
VSQIPDFTTANLASEIPVAAPSAPSDGAVVSDIVAAVSVPSTCSASW